MARKLVRLEEIEPYLGKERVSVILQLVVGDLMGNVTHGRLARLPVGQRALYLISALNGEVNNGGLHQYFSNSSGDFAHQTLASLRYVHADEAALLLLEALNKFPERRASEDREEREQQLKQIELPGTKRAEWDPFHHLDARYYDLCKTPSNPWQKAVEHAETCLKDFVG